MLCELMDLQRSSPSPLFSEERNFGEFGFWKTGTMPEHYVGGNPISLSPLEQRMGLSSRLVKCPKMYGDEDQKVLDGLQKPVVGNEVAARQTLSRLCDPNLQTRSDVNVGTSYFMAGGKVNVMCDQYENGLFSSSLSDLFSGKLSLSSNSGLYGRSVGAAASHSEEEEPFESMEEIESQTIGNLLPSDDDLLSGVTDGLDCGDQHGIGDEVGDLDLFSIVGGMDLGEDSAASMQRNLEISGHSYNNLLGRSNGSTNGELPSRTLFVRNISSSVEDSELRILFGQYGEIRTLYTACKHRGFVMISYYDIRAARNAMTALQNKPLRRRKLDIHFSIPKDNPSDKDDNQGTLVNFNVDSSVSNDQLRQIFGIYGEIKEIHETSHRSHKKFIDFYDIRAAEAALDALNESDIAGRKIKIEPSYSGGAKCLMQPLHGINVDEFGAVLDLFSPPNDLSTGIYVETGQTTPGRIDSGLHFASGLPANQLLDNKFHISSTVPSSLQSLLRVESVGTPSSVVVSSQSQDQIKFDVRSMLNCHPHSLPEHHDGLANSALSRPPTGHHFLWSDSHIPQPHAVMWPKSIQSFTHGVSNVHTAPRFHAVPLVPSRILPVDGHHVGSAPALNPSIWDRRQAYAGEYPDASPFLSGSLGSLGNSVRSLHPFDFVSHGIFPRPGGTTVDMPIPSTNIGPHFHHRNCVLFPSRGQMIPIMGPVDSPNERVRSRRNEIAADQADNKKHFELDIERIVRGDDRRTTLMIKNIPNKYTSKMLLAAIDERLRGTYDFIYLPIDFKNKCNVGYAFINMTDPSFIIPFYQGFNGKKWEKFNSEKVATLAYARIQGKAALIAHFQNSSLMNEDKRCRPILFHSDGPNAGDQAPFPMGVNIRSRPNKNRASPSEENNLESPQELSKREVCFNGDSSLGLAKEFD